MYLTPEQAMQVKAKEAIFRDLIRFLEDQALRLINDLDVDVATANKIMVEDLKQVERQLSGHTKQRIGF